MPNRQLSQTPKRTRSRNSIEPAPQFGLTGGHADHSTINVHTYISTYWLFLTRNHKCPVKNNLKQQNYNYVYFNLAYPGGRAV